MKRGRIVGRRECARACCAQWTEQLEPRRLMAAGALDSSFDGDGKLGLPTGYKANDVAALSDGRSIVVGNASPGRSFAQRLNVDGSIDTTFGERGVTIFNADGANAVVVQDDGKIVIAGEKYDSKFPVGVDKYDPYGNGEGIELIRLNANGSLDTTLDGDGIATKADNGDTVFPDTFGAARDIAVEPDYTNDGVYNPKYVVVASVFDDYASGHDYDMLVTRWTSAGKLDSSFDGDGVKYSAFGDDDRGNAVAIDRNGTAATNPYYGDIYIGGAKGDPASSRAAIARLKPNGSFDNSFDSDGLISLSFLGQTSFSAWALLPVADGKVIVAGKTSTGSNNDFGVVRLAADGKIDNTFASGTQGYLRRNFGVDDWARNIISTPSGFIVGGTSDGRFALVAYTSAGLLDPFELGGDGTKILSGTSSGLNGFDRAFNTKRIVLAGGPTVERILEPGANVAYISTLVDTTMAEDPANNNTTASFYVYRTEKLTTPTRVFLSAGGTATAIGGVGGTSFDFTGFSNSPIADFVDIPANQTFVLVTLTVTNDTRIEGTEFAVFTVLPNANYEVGSPSSTTITIFDNDGSTLNALADATVRGGTNANTNFGNSSTLDVKQNNNAELQRQVYLKFDLGSVTTINSAKLMLFGSLNNPTPTNMPVGVYSASNTSWTETGITFSNKPSTSSSALSTATVTGTVGQWYTWDVTSYLKAQKAAGHNIVTLVLKTSVVTDPYALFNSDEATNNRPQLVLG